MQGQRLGPAGPCSACGQTEEVEGSNFTRRVSEDVGQEARSNARPHDLDRTHQPLTKIIAKTEDSYPHADCFRMMLTQILPLK
jgi:hypothetical protein